MRLGALVVAAMIACGSGAAFGQTPAEPLAEEAPKPFDDPTPFAGPIPTVEEVMERLRGMLGAVSPFGPAGAATVSSSSDIRRGDVIIAVPVAPRRVGRLENDLVQRGNLFSRDRVVLPAGAPVFYTTFRYQLISGYGVVLQQRDYDAWCGVVREGRRERERGYCALQAPGFNDVGVVNAGSPYMPGQLAGPHPGSPVTVREDPSALAEFPRLEMTYTFVEFDETDADVRRGVRVDGGAVQETNNVSLRREPDGSSVLSVAGGEIRLLRTDSRREARIEVTTPPSAYDPGEEDVQLRLLAEAVVARLRARAASGEAWPTPPPPQSAEPPPPAQP